MSAVDTWWLPPLDLSKAYRCAFSIVLPGSCNRIVSRPTVESDVAHIHVVAN